MFMRLIAMRIFLLLFISSVLISCSQPVKNDSNAALSADITPEDIQSHIAFLADDSLKGRETGTAGEAVAARYIADHFKQFGLQPVGDDSTYYQQFTVNMSAINNPHNADTTSFPDEDRIARNVVGLVKGSDQPGTYIVIGAHYDHLGTGKFGSLYNRDDSQIHNGADDNASGTSGILELAHYFSNHTPKKSLLFITFSGEEMGLLGSQHFVQNPTAPLKQMQAMINLDMIGRLNDNKLLIFGTGTSKNWDTLITKVNSDSLSIKTVPDGTGASDHTSFYNKQIPVLHYFTDTHADYHRPSDDAEYINFEGQDKVLEHLKRLIITIDTLDAGQLTYTQAPVTQDRNVVMEGPTLGVTPDYGFEGGGMRITGVRSGGPADEAGLESGDIIVQLNGKELKDIYEYMDVLNTLNEGEQTTVTVQRNDAEQTFTITL
jgi:hypothetical protein